LLISSTLSLFLDRACLSCERGLFLTSKPHWEADNDQ
jgi:hypothetical protein